MTDRKTLLILCQNYPPETSTSAARPYAWAKYLSEGDFNIRVICKGDSNRTEIISENLSVRYVECKDDFFVLLHRRFNKFKVLSYIMSMLQIVFENELWYSNKKPIYIASSEYIEKDRNAKILVTARPFILFGLAYQLHKAYQVQWIADYRDDWCTTELFNFEGIKFKWLTNYLLKRNAKKEKKWVKSAIAFTSVSPFYVQKIFKFLDNAIPGYTIENGYFEEEINTNPEEIELYNDFTITYIGACYPSQDFSILLETIKAYKENPGHRNIILQFVGSGFSSYLKKLIQDIFQENVPIKIIPKVSKIESLHIQRRSHALVMVPHKNVKGVASSKIYEYVMTSKPVILCPSDNDILDTIVLQVSNSLIFSSNIDENIEKLKTLHDLYHRSNNRILPQSAPPEKLSRRYQTMLLRDILVHYN